MDYKKRVTEFIKTAKPRSAGHKISSQDGYLDGVVAKVEYTDSGNQISEWVIITKKHEGRADSENQLILQMGIASTKASGKLDILNQILNISGIIALILVSTSAYLTIKSTDGNIPEHLKASVLTIVGFYFGGLIQQKRKKTIDP